eukprot:Colp12_sorted_trinity150504_noHs@11367
MLYTKEMEMMMENAQSLLRDSNTKATFFTTATRIEHVRPMFKLLWTPALAAFSVPLKNSDDPSIVHLCLEGFRCAIRVASIFYMELERDAFVQSLAKFTNLGASAMSSISEMKTKNIEAIKTLLSIAHTEGNYLQRSWYEILKCVSQLELAQIISSNTSSNDDPMARKLTPSAQDLTRRNVDRAQLDNIKRTLGETNSQSILVAVDKVFTQSVQLNGDAIVDCVKWLCVVSVEERQEGKPRMFMLVKIVEIAYYN